MHRLTTREDGLIGAVYATPGTTVAERSAVLNVIEVARSMARLPDRIAKDDGEGGFIFYFFAGGEERLTGMISLSEDSCAAASAYSAGAVSNLGIDFDIYNTTEIEDATKQLVTLIQAYEAR